MPWKIYSLYWWENSFSFDLFVLMDMVCILVTICTKLIIQDHVHRQHQMEKADSVFHNYIWIIAISESGVRCFYLQVDICFSKKLAVCILWGNCCKLTRYWIILLNQLKEASSILCFFRRELLVLHALVVCWWIYVSDFFLLQCIANKEEFWQGIALLNFTGKVHERCL